MPEALERHRRHGTTHDAFILELLDAATPGLPARARDDTEMDEALSDSELRVLRFLPSNLSAPEIAAQLYLSTSTVKTHMRHIYAKLGVHTRTEAVAKARERGLLVPVVNLRR
jgi:LuxR family maltose regulon positive regulatory protein